MTQPLNFQSIIMTLQHFWADQGCLIWQPYYQQVGAGTLNPATALRVLGPEPWNAGYVEPSIRPDDGRYGENPNRMQMHYQFQVILKPDPGDPQEMYLRSLQALGVDPRQHDIRFVEDNWESPALGAWGLGWEVWLDGQEITQFTYFQQAGGTLCDPVAVEITYGLDRIAIALQRVNSFTDIQWNDQLTCGDINLQAEQEHSTYYFDLADVERMRQMYELYQQEANACLEKNLVLPAHDYVLKCSHTFNVLDARGAIGITERQAFFGRMRDLSRRVAEAYLAQRQRLEYPFDDKFPNKGSASSTTIGPASIKGFPNKPHPSSPAPFLLEIGTEELPAGDLDAAIEQLQVSFSALLDRVRLDHGLVHVSGTPRRLVVYVEDLNPYQPDLEQVVKGPPADRAFDALGQPTKAAEGFARSKGVSVHDLEVREMDGGRYATALVKQTGRLAANVLAEELPVLLSSLRFDKVMRWNRTNLAFSRPIRWLLALYGEHIVPFTHAGLDSNNITRGLRFHPPEEMPVKDAADYFRLMAEHGIILKKEERQAAILAQVEALAAKVEGTIVADPDLLSEVANLIEAPTALRGSFDHAYLSLPREVLVSVMKKHQRYFPVFHQPAAVGNNQSERLLPYFITVANKPYAPAPGSGPCEGAELIVEGNEHVIRARFADADFFVRDDRKHKIEDFLPRLGTLIFQTKLGSMLDKSRRVTALVEVLAPLLSLDAQESASALRAAHLCKADLATRMVIEMTSLQGIIGRYYALSSGESLAVGQAIFEHYLPRFAGDSLPQSKVGLVVGLADRLDTLAALFAADLAPTGAKDPFAQRRAALGLVQALMAHDLDLDLRPALQAAASHLPISSTPESQAACLDFIIERLRNLLLDAGDRYDAVDAVIAAQGFNPARTARAVRELSSWVERPDWNAILPTYSRCVRIIRSAALSHSLPPLNPGLFAEPAELELHTALLAAEATLHAAQAAHGAGSPDGLMQAFLPMMPAVNQFFDQVLVMTDDIALRENRLALVQRIASLADGIVDLSKLEGF